MTRTLKKAFAEATKLSEKEQDALGEWLLAELRSERDWENFFRRSHDVLDRLADRALEEYRSGQTRELDPKKL